MATPTLDIKHTESRLEDGPAQDVLAPMLKSEFDDLGLWKSVLRFKKAVTICTLLNIAAAADGYQINMNGQIIANTGFVRQIGFPNANGVYTLNAKYTALWGALQSLGQMIGMIFLNPISDRIGRKYTLYVLWVVLLGSIVIETCANNWQHWAGAKLLAGVGVGAIQATLPIYVTEWSPVNIRGAMISAYSVWNQVGNFMAPLILLVLKRPDQWRIAIYTQWAFLGIMLPIFVWLPETPSYFAAKGQHDKGKAVLRRVNGGVAGYDVEAEYAIVVHTIDEERRFKEENGLTEGGFKSLMQSYAACLKGVNLKRTLGSSLPLMGQQLTGLSFLSTYASLFFRQSGFSNAFTITTIIFAIKIAAILAVILIADKFGRRLVTLIAIGLATAMLLLVGILGQLQKTEPLRILLILAACIWSLASAALSATGYTFVGEVSAQRLRARTAGVATSMAVVFGLTFNTSVPIMLDVNGANWGYNTAWLFMATGALVFVAAFFLLPEPAQRNAAELDEMYEKGVPPRKMKAYETDVQKSRRD